MKINREGWLAEDSNGDTHFFYEEPKKLQLPSGHCWSSKGGHILPLRGFEPELKNLVSSKSIDLKNTPIRLSLSLEA